MHGPAMVTNSAYENASTSQISGICSKASLAKPMLGNSVLGGLPLGLQAGISLWTKIILKGSLSCSPLEAGCSTLPGPPGCCPLCSGQPGGLRVTPHLLTTISSHMYQPLVP
jgi:hypothetical protein